MTALIESKSSKYCVCVVFAFELQTIILQDHSANHFSSSCFAISLLFIELFIILFLFHQFQNKNSYRQHTFECIQTILMRVLCSINEYFKWYWDQSYSARCWLQITNYEFRVSLSWKDLWDVKHQIKCFAYATN